MSCLSVSPAVTLCKSSSASSDSMLEHASCIPRWSIFILSDELVKASRISRWQACRRPVAGSIALIGPNRRDRVKQILQVMDSVSLECLFLRRHSNNTSCRIVLTFTVDMQMQPLNSPNMSTFPRNATATHKRGVILVRARAEEPGLGGQLLFAASQPSQSSDESKQLNRHRTVGKRSANDERAERGGRSKARSNNAYRGSHQ